MTLSPDIAAHIRQVMARLEVQRVLVFGSYARGDYDAYSDLDVIIVYETERPFLERFRDFEALFDLPMAVELLAYTPAEFAAMVEAENPFIHHVLGEAIELTMLDSSVKYSKDSGNKTQRI